MAGTGPVGLAVALQCATAGLRVLVLESGTERVSREHQRLSTFTSDDDIIHAPAHLTVRRILGGTSTMWGGRCVEYDDIDFARRGHVAGSGWPIAHGTLQPYYDTARRFLSSDFDAIAPSPGESGFQTNSLESWTRDRNTAHYHRETLKLSPNILVCTDSTLVDVRMRDGGNAVEAFVIRSRGQETVVRAGCFVLACGGRENARLLLNLQSRFPAMFGGDGGPLGRRYMGHLAGEIACIEFADSQLAEAFFFRQAGRQTFIRHRFRPTDETQRRHDLLNIAFWPKSPPPEDASHSDGVASALHMMSRLRMRARHRPGRQIDPTVASAHLSNILRKPGPAMIGAARYACRQLIPQSRYPHYFLRTPDDIYLLHYHSEHAPNDASRITLSSNKDDFGVNRLSVSFRYGDQDFQSVVRAHELLDEWLRARGYGRLRYLDESERRVDGIKRGARDGYHQIGLTRMSDQPRDGVVDTDCTAHGIANLSVAGSSVFPTSGQANPTLAAVALAQRLGDHLTAMLATRGSSIIRASRELPRGSASR
ncbi:GMC oxidoreductase [Aurantimonas manganoxydans]|uniref:GMC oxidoreductase n=1 Tax=Aurantimonas manganoxydans TaxID=651183 RepID=UPI000304EDA9|nr:GMC oxidoreductase [Aurantimonas manganoxydans]